MSPQSFGSQDWLTARCTVKEFAMVKQGNIVRSQEIFVFGPTLLLLQILHCWAIPGVNRSTSRGPSSLSCPRPPTGASMISSSTLLLPSLMVVEEEDSGVPSGLLADCGQNRVRTRTWKITGSFSLTMSFSKWRKLNFRSCQQVTSLSVSCLLTSDCFSALEEVPPLALQWR